MVFTCVNILITLSLILNWDFLISASSQKWEFLQIICQESLTQRMSLSINKIFVFMSVTCLLLRHRFFDRKKYIYKANKTYKYIYIGFPLEKMCYFIVSSNVEKNPIYFLLWGFHWNKQSDVKKDKSYTEC